MYPKIPFKHNYMFSVDWLQIFCSREVGELDPTRTYTSPRTDMWHNHRDYYLRPAREFLHGYRQQFRVMWKTYEVATIAYDHVDSRVSRHACAIKAANAILYVADWRFIIEDVMATFNFTPQNITRCDLCCDFNRFASGMDPALFMKRYLEDRHPKHETYTRVGTDKFAINGAKSVSSCVVETIRWGSRQNGVSTYMYNKSLELQQHKYKQYICRAWDEAGIIYKDPKHPVWRVEFSISSKGVHLQDLELGQMHDLWLDDFDNRDKVRELFKVFAAKYFRFKVVPKLSDYLPKKDNLQDLDLFRFDDVLPLMPKTLCVSVDSGKTERMISKRLAQMAQDLDDASFFGGADLRKEQRQIEQAAEVFDAFADIKQFRRDFEKNEERGREAGVPLDSQYYEAIWSMHQRDRIAAKVHELRERDFLFNVKKRVNSLKISTLGGGDGTLGATPVSQKGGHA